MSLHNLCSLMTTLGFRVCVAKAYFVGTCHKDLEQIFIYFLWSSYLIYFIYIIVPGSGLVDAMVATRYLNIYCLYSSFVFVIPKDRSHDR